MPRAADWWAGRRLWLWRELKDARFYATWVYGGRNNVVLRVQLPESAIRLAYPRMPLDDPMRGVLYTNERVPPSRVRMVR